MHSTFGEGGCSDFDPPICKENDLQDQKFEVKNHVTKGMQTVSTNR